MDDHLTQGEAGDTVYDNLFRDIWLDAGFKNLPPENLGDYEISYDASNTGRGISWEPSWNSAARSH